MGPSHAAGCEQGRVLREQEFKVFPVQAVNQPAVGDDHGVGRRGRSSGRYGIQLPGCAIVNSLAFTNGGKRVSWELLP